MAADGWHFWIDRGGTFTDVVARRPDGKLVTHKLLSRNPGVYDDAVVQGIRDVLGLAPAQELPRGEIDEIRVGTTVGTNALLEKQGTPTVLLITRGLADLPRIGYQNRPDLFALHIRLPRELHERTIEVEERLDAEGSVLVELHRERLTNDLRAAFAAGFRSCAVALMHAWRRPDHEIAAGDIARQVGFEQVSLSHEVSPGIKIVRRADTAVVDAYISPVLKSYVDRLNEDLAGPRLWFMGSAGGLLGGRYFRGRDSLLSGPAGGVIGAVATARAAGISRVIGFDMGGTSTDVSHYGGELERRHESEIAGVRLQIPMLHIETVAAGGGSILDFDGRRFRVGPRSAGADPGPACYGRGGPLTVTDANLLLGRIQPDFFPAIFGPGRDRPLDGDVVRAKFAELAEELAAAGTEKEPEEIAAGFFTIANENMARAIKKISVQQGHDLRDYTLNCFGGAGGQHACAIASTLGIRRVLSHTCAGVLSAYGIGRADLRMNHGASLEASLEDSLTAGRIVRTREELERRGRDALVEQGCPDEGIDFECTARLRYAGSDTHLEIELAAPAPMRAAFAALHEERFGFAYPEQEIILKEVSVIAVGRLHPADANENFTRTANRDNRNNDDERGNSNDGVRESRTIRLFTGGRWHYAPVLRREQLPAGFAAEGPLLIAGATDTTVIDPGWSARVTPSGDLFLEHTAAGAQVDPETRTASESKDTGPDPILLEIYHNRFQSIADEMGLVLQSTASSVNIKERLDFSCALFNSRGDLVASAPHIPVHLGSMSDSVRAIRNRFAKIGADEVFVTNNPYDGGTHLPDVTVITPCFLESGAAGTPAYFLAARGHHADIGGTTPGSMPAHSNHVREEGVLIEARKLVKDGRLDEAGLRDLLAGGEFPARNIEQNLADLKAQIAANRRGNFLLNNLIGERGAREVQAYTDYIQSNAAETVRSLIPRIATGSYALSLDDDSRVHVALRTATTENENASVSDPDGDAGATKDTRLIVDFRESSRMSPGNLNAPSSVVRSAVLYVMRTLVQDSIPLNEGCLQPLDILLPAGSLLAPEHPAAVVGGNVETSQIIVDVLLGALGALAGSQGTMNNLTFGNATHQYYETICGGTGAGPGFAGASAVHSHMTNSRLTDPEILEARFPVLLIEFALRANSGGAGRYSGGAGVRRRLRFRESMRVSLLTGRRRYAPRGLAGGEDGQPGANILLKNNGTRAFWNETTRERIPLEFRAEFDVAGGDDLVIETPGGGGYGNPDYPRSTGESP